jgi:hypothetical protein
MLMAMKIEIKCFTSNYNFLDTYLVSFDSLLCIEDV